MRASVRNHVRGVCCVGGDSHPRCRSSSPRVAGFCPGAAVALRILLLPEAAQAYGAASFTMVAVIAAFAWGMWQVWLICAVGLLPLYLLMSAALPRLRRDRARVSLPCQKPHPRTARFQL
jgi:hypothetical protein